jgi:hypothetical protein
VANLLSQYEHPKALLRSAWGRLIQIKWFAEAGLCFEPGVADVLVASARLSAFGKSNAPVTMLDC